MKRSEPLDMITNIIRDERDNLEPSDLAEMILDTLENVGMEPPARPNDYGAVNNLGVVTLINEWENE